MRGRMLMRGWMLAGMRRNPGPLIGTLVAVVTAAMLTVASVSMLAAQATAPAGRLAGASVVVAGNTQVSETIGHGEDAETQSAPLSAYRGVPMSLAQRLAQVTGVASAVGESGFPGGVVRPGDVDLIAVTARPGVTPDVLAQRIKTALNGGRGYTIATGAARGDVANLNVAAERTNGRVLAASVVPVIVMIAFFVLAGTTALSVSLRRRRFALLRAIGATRGQVRRAILGELTLLGAAGGALACLPGALLGAAGARALADHGLFPPGSAAWLSPWLLLISCGASVLVAALSGWIAARRAARVSPAQALRDSHKDPKWPHPVRILLGLGAMGGAGALMTATFNQNTPDSQLSLAGPLLMVCMVAVALLGPLLVAFAAWLARSLRNVVGSTAGGASARLALASIAAQPRRTASAVIPVALAVALVSSIYFANQTATHNAASQSASTVTATDVLSGDGLTTSVLHQVMNQAGVHAAAGMAPVTVAAADPDLEQVYGEIVTDGPLTQVLDLGVTSGSLTALRPGQIAVSALEAGNLGVHAGSRATVYLPDGTPYQATVSAIYSRSLAFGDLLLPAAVAAGHTGTPPGFTEVLVSGGTAAGLSAVAAGHPGLHVASRSVYNAKSQQASAQDNFANNLILGVISLLAAVSLVNTLVVAIVERRRLLRLLGRLGTTRGQLTAMFGWHALFVALTGVLAGIAAGAATLLGVTRALTGTWTPYITPGPAIAIIAVVGVLTAASILIPFRLMARREPTLAS
ncbi:MAG TPA: FtsX-like permease family protein [Streptosporangiaceae bacterium]